jgi:pimeloyl-ACP methyl ester carboxylesterase
MPNNQINGKSLYYTISGLDQVAKATVVLIHGLGSSSSYYFPVIPYLTPSIRCIAIDIAGSGSSNLGSSEQSILSIVKDIVSQLDALGIKDKVVVVGHSMGGIVASQLAAYHSERVSGVVLIGPVHPGDALSEVFKSRIEVVKRGMPKLFTRIG